MFISDSLRQRLFSINIYRYYEQFFGKSRKATAYADKVMRFVSREFTRAIYGEVFSAVCGAGFNRIFFEIELPELIANEKVQTINGIPMKRIREIYFSQGIYMAFREICLAEIELAKQRAWKEDMQTAKEDLNARFRFFRMEGKETAKIFKNNWQKPSKELKKLCAKLWNNSLQTNRQRRKTIRQKALLLQSLAI